MGNLLYYLRLEAEDSFLFFWLREIVIAFGILFLFYGLSRLLRHMLLSHAPQLAARLKLDPDGSIVSRITGPASTAVLWIGLYLAIEQLPLPEKVHLVATGALFVVNVVIVSVIAYRMGQGMLARFARRVDGEELSRQLVPVLEKVLSIFLMATALIIILKHFNYDIVSLVTALGIGSLAIGLAAKDTLANMFSGFTLMVDRPFTIGDRVQVAAGQVGDVIDIGLRSTRLKGLDNNYLVIPNSVLCNTTIVNTCLPDVRHRGRLNLRVAFDCDVVTAKRLLVESALSQGGVLKDPVPEAFVTGFGEMGVELALQFQAQRSVNLMALTDQISCAILANFQENSIKIPFPTRTVLLEKDKEHAP